MPAFANLFFHKTNNKQLCKILCINYGRPFY